MAEKRSFFKSLFGHKDKKGIYTKVEFLGSSDSGFTQWSNNAYDMDIVRSAISANCSNVAKLNPKHIRRSGNTIVEFPDTNIKRLLTRPNPHMNMFDFLYKVMAQREETNNAFIYCKFDDMGNLEALYPINASRVELLETNDGTLYARFSFRVGKQVIIPYSELIHIRKHFNKNDFYGEGNETCLNPTLEVINTTNQGIVNAIKNSAVLKGLLEFRQILKEEDIKSQVDKFIANYMTINNQGGVAATDPRYNYRELKTEPYVPNKAQMDYTKDRIYSYFGVNENIIQSKFTEDEWNAYYENTVEPVAIQLSLEFTEKIFSNREKGHGNEIVFEANRLQYASASTKISLVRDLAPLGIFTINEAREIFNLAPVEGGEKRIQTLNVVNADKADKYQGVNEEGDISDSQNNQE